MKRIQTALIVSANSSLSHVALVALESLYSGVKLSVVGTSEEAVTAYSDIMPDLFVVDDELPDDGAMEVLQLLRGHADGQDAIVLFCTRNSNPGYAAGLREKAVNGVVVRPIDTGKISAALERALENAA